MLRIGQQCTRDPNPGRTTAGRDCRGPVGGARGRIAGRMAAPPMPAALLVMEEARDGVGEGGASSLRLLTAVRSSSASAGVLCKHRHLPAWAS